jgi:maltose O-acetyltransferase
VGEGAIVGAGSVLVKDVEPYTVVAGNPATVLREVNYKLDPEFMPDDKPST